MLIPLKEMMQAARAGRYAVGAFNCLSLENVSGAIAAAERLHSPIILQLAEVQFADAPPELMAPLLLQAARRASIPVTVHLDHGQSLETCVKALMLGFNSVMFDGAALPFAQNVETTSRVVQIARAAGADIEAELGRVGDTGFGGGEGTGTASDDDPYTDPEEAAQFVAQTGIDALAIAIGNRHGRYRSTPQLSIDRLQQIARHTDLPLVLHGGSGTSEADFRACAANGICKINVATAMQMAVAERIRAYVAATPDPDYMTMKRLAVEASHDCVAAHIELFSSAGRA